MTKKDYVAIAEAVRTATTETWPNPDQHGGRWVSKADLVSNLCSVLRADNARFDSYRFLEACSTKK
jgi:hypothetical protein